MRPFATRMIPLLLSLISALMVPTITLAQAPIDTPQTNLTPINPPPTTYSPPGAAYGQFDPYAPATSGGFGAGGPTLGGGGFGGALPPGATAIGPPTPIGPPTTAPAPNTGGFFDNTFSNPVPSAPPPLSPSFGTPASGPVWNGQAYGSPPVPYNNPNVYGPPVGGPTLGSPYPNSAYPSATPSTLFPSGVFAGDYSTITDPVYSAYRFMQGPRFRYTYISTGSNPSDLGINDFDSSLVFAFPNFGYMQQPLYVVPSFSLHLWDGPDGVTGADLPPNAYSAFIDTGWQSDPNKMFSTEFGVRFGAFTDFDTWTSKSFRVKGKALASFRLSPFSTLKGGVYYMDRRKIKLLPAFGFLCQPNPFTRYDIFFPEPKIARYCSTVGTQDVWWYMGAEYGGGTWTVTRTTGDRLGDQERVDINDIRVTTGFEWGESVAIRAGRRTAFTEIGYVFNRELRYYQNTDDDIDPGSAFLFRAGFRY